MRGAIGIVIGIVIIAPGLGGLGLAFTQMMTHANAQSALTSVGGLAVFAAACLFLLLIAYRG